MIKMTLDELRQTELNILGFIDGVCRENGITYYLAWGTLLGAVRHRGFIPWDDDIDISIPRKHYKRFINLINNLDNQDKKYIIMSADQNSEYEHFFVKVVDSTTTINNGIKDYGVNIDVFPIDNLPNNKCKRMMMIKTAWLLKTIAGYAYKWGEKSKTESLTYKIKSILCYFYGYKRARDQFEKLCMKTANDETDYMCELADAENIWFSRKCFSSIGYYFFENKKYPGPIDYNEYLTTAYGDYMKLPPLEQRRSHGVTAYNKVSK